MDLTFNLTMDDKSVDVYDVLTCIGEIQWHGAMTFRISSDIRSLTLHQMRQIVAKQEQIIKNNWRWID